MHFAAAKELERLYQQEASSKRLKDFDARAKEIDSTISRRSGGWHAARTDLAFARIEATVDDRIAIRKVMVERCPELAAPYETLQFEKQESAVVEESFQAVLQSFHVGAVRPPASILSGLPTRKLTLRHKLHTAGRIMQLEAASQHPKPTGPTGPIRQEKQEDVITVKPAIWGISVNLNEVWRLIWPRVSRTVWFRKN